MPKPMRILFVAAEAAPLVKTGGLADVVRALPHALREQGHDVRLAIPCYGQIPEASKGKSIRTCYANLGGKTHIGCLRESVLPGTEVPLYLIEHDGYFRREHPYGYAAGHEYEDNLERFCFFCMAILDAIPQLEWRPDIIHCHDWHTGVLPAYLRLNLHPNPIWRGTPSVFTIHNLGYQGRFGGEHYANTGLPWELFTPEFLEFEGRVNLMKAGIGFASKINTVSATYAREIQTMAYGQGLDGFLRTRRADLSGIVNGIDYAEWNPAHDPHIAAHYNVEDMAGKARCKAALQDRLQLPASDAPLFCMVTRLVWDKGIDLVASAMEQLVSRGIQLAILGSGEPRLQVALEHAAARHPDQVSVVLGYNEPLAHQMYAGGDFFLMPSLTEPCGLSQMYSLAYGAIPVVRKTGGLADTIVDASPVNIAKNKANGIVFGPGAPEELARAVFRAIRLYEAPETLEEVRRLGMREDLSWRRASKEYVELYAEAIKKP